MPDKTKTNWWNSKSNPVVLHHTYWKAGLRGCMFKQLLNQSAYKSQLSVSTWKLMELHHTKWETQLAVSVRLNTTTFNFVLPGLTLGLCCNHKCSLNFLNKFWQKNARKSFWCALLGHFLVRLINQLIFEYSPTNALYANVIYICKQFMQHTFHSLPPNETKDRQQKLCRMWTWLPKITPRPTETFQFQEDHTTVHSSTV